MITNKELLEKIMSEMTDEHNGLIDLFPKPVKKPNLYRGGFQTKNHFLDISTDDLTEDEFYELLNDVLNKRREYHFYFIVGVKTIKKPHYTFSSEYLSDLSNVEEIVENKLELINIVKEYLSECKFLFYKNAFSINDDTALEFSIEMKYDITKERKSKITFIQN